MQELRVSHATVRSVVYLMPPSAAPSQRKARGLVQVGAAAEQQPVRRVAARRETCRLQPPSHFIERRPFRIALMIALRMPEIRGKCAVGGIECVRRS